MADFATKTGTGGTPVPNTYDSTPSLTDRVPITGGRETAVQDIVDTAIALMDVDTGAMTEVLGRTGTATRTVRTLAEFATDMAADDAAMDTIHAEMQAREVEAPVELTATDVDYYQVIDNLGVASLITPAISMDAMLAAPGVPAAIGAGATIQVGTVPRTLESKEYELISVKDYGAVGDGVMSDSAAFQAAADNCDVNFSTYVFVPNYDETYLITTPVVFQYPDIKIFGFKGAGYQRGTTGDLRRGNILIGSGAAHAIDLGASRTTAPTGQWNVANIGIQQAAGVAVRTKNGIALTAKHDGPHRGAVFKEVSAIGLNAAIYIPDPEVSTSLCNLIIENCCLSNNNYSLLCEGNVLGLRFVGNQAEQNAFGAIHGNFSCGIYIADNMLEGQPNPIYLKAYAPVGNRPKVAIERNYFEGVSGNYVIKIESSTPDADIIIRNNYSDNNSASDYVRISNPGPYYIEMYDSFPVTHTSSVTFTYGSKFLEKFPYFQIRLKDDTAIQWWHSIKEYSNLVDNAALNTHVIFSSGAQEYTPYGYKYIRYNADLIDIPLSGVVGDLIAINVLCSIGAGGLIKPKLFNESDQDVAISEYSQYMKANGRWSLVTIGLRIQTNGATTMKFQLFEATSTVILGVAARNYGATTINEEATKIDIYPVIPNIP